MQHVYPWTNSLNQTLPKGDNYSRTEPLRSARDEPERLSITRRHWHQSPLAVSLFPRASIYDAVVNPDLVVRDDNGEIYTLRYDAVNAMLLNEFLKEHRTVQELKSAAVKQEAMIANQQKQIEALTAGLQRVSAQLELSKSAPQTVLNNR